MRKKIWFLFVVVLFVFCFGKISLTNAATGAWVDKTGNLSGSSIFSIIQATDGSIYAGGYDFSSSSAKVWRYSAGAWIDITGTSLETRISSLIQAADGSIYAGGFRCIDSVVCSSTSAKVWNYSGGVWTDVTGALSGSSISSLIQAADGTLYAGGKSNDYPWARVWKYSAGAWQDITGTILGSSIFTLAQGADGSIYAGGDGTSAGPAKVWKYSAGAWMDITGALYGGAVSSLVRAFDGSIYAGGTSGDNAIVWKYTFDVLEQQEYNLEKGERVVLMQGLDNQSISGQDLAINFTKLPTKLIKNNKYWMKWNKLSKYPNKTFLKNWKLTTNLYKYKVKKSSQKFKIKVSFNYTKKNLKKFLKKNKSATKSNLIMKYKQGTSWKDITSVFTDAKVIKKNKKFIVKYFTNFPVKTQYFAIGVK